VEVSDISDAQVGGCCTYLSFEKHTYSQKEDRMDVLDLEGIDDDLELETELQVEVMETGRSYPCRE
jgi:hypothetical protein